MSKQSEAKERQGYIEKPSLRKCSTCRYYSYEVETRKDWADVEYEIKKKIRCAIGGFTIKANAICNRFDFSE